MGAAQGGPWSCGTEGLGHLSAALVPPVSLLQLWDTVHGQLAFQHTSPRPVNCAAFHPEGQVIAIGSWAGSFSFLRVDGLKVTKVRRSCVALGWAWKVGNAGCPHFGAVLRAGHDISTSTSPCRNWELLEPLSVPWPSMCLGGLWPWAGWIGWWSCGLGRRGHGWLPSLPTMALWLLPFSCVLGASY